MWPVEGVEGVAGERESRSFARIVGERQGEKAERQA